MQGHNSKAPAGFIFMCNGRTKPQCYQYRVFGVPMGKREFVEKIKVGAKLFLYDFELKLLYGVYEATSEGNMNLEPAAFDGKFPAQVRFRIFMECIPLTEKSVRSAIRDNYTGSKFKQELDEIQVMSLISLFPRLPAASSIHMPLLLPNTASAQGTLSSRTEHENNYPAGMLSSGDQRGDSDLTVTQQAHVQTNLLSSLYPYLHALQPVRTQEVQTSLHLQQPTSLPVQHSIQAIQGGYHPASTNSYHYTDSQQSYFIEGQAPITQDHYPWYGATQGVVLGHQHVYSGSDHRPVLLQRGGETALHQGTVSGYHHESASRPPRDSYQNGANYHYSMPPAGYGSSTVQPQAPAPGCPQGNVPTFPSYPSHGS